MPGHCERAGVKAGFRAEGRRNSITPAQDLLGPALPLGILTPQPPELRERGELGTGTPSHRFYVSDAPANFARIARAFLGRELPAPTVVDQTDLPWFERFPDPEPSQEIP